MLCRTDGGNDIYIGSTSCPLKQRFSQHKQDAGNPSRLKWYGGSKNYKKMREVGVQHWKIVPLLTFSCNRETICEFEHEWVKTTGANLNTVPPVNENVARRGYDKQRRRKNKELKLYYCGLCNVTFMHNRDLKKHLDTLKHSYNYLNSLD